MAKNRKPKTKNPAKKGTNEGTHKLNKQYYTQCASTNYDGFPCGNLVESEVGNDMVEHGRLPVCDEHISHMMECMPGSCEATLPSGKRCKNFIPAEPGYNQLCRHHKDAVLRCHILRLPSEVRLMIIDRVIPEGPVRHMPFEHLYMYKIALSLMLTCRKISSEAHSVLYNTRKRPLVTSVNRVEVHLRDQRYGAIGNTRVNILGGTHTSQLSHGDFGPFRHLRVIAASKVISKHGDGDFYPVVEMFCRLLHAIAR